MKRLIVGISLMVLALSGCERIFTTSPFTFLQRDPSTLTEEQKLAYAEDALASGDADAMAAAFDALKESTDPETQLVAVELALGAAGVESILTETIASLSGSELSEAEIDAVLNDALLGLDEADMARIVVAAGLLDSADDSVQPTAEQYAFTALGLIAVAANEAGGLAELDDPGLSGDAADHVSQAVDFLNAAVAALMAEGESTDLLDGLLTEIDGV